MVVESQLPIHMLVVRNAGISLIDGLLLPASDSPLEHLNFSIQYHIIDRYLNPAHINRPDQLWPLLEPVYERGLVDNFG
jgi:hypothetical protein